MESRSGTCNKFRSQGSRSELGDGEKSESWLTTDTSEACELKSDEGNTSGTGNDKYLKTGTGGEPRSDGGGLPWSGTCSVIGSGGHEDSSISAMTSGGG